MSDVEFGFDMDGTDLFIVMVRGRAKPERIAKRGHKGTPEAGTWIPIVPGYKVTGDAAEIAVEYEGEKRLLLQVASRNEHKLH